MQTLTWHNLAWQGSQARGMPSGHVARACAERAPLPGLVNSLQSCKTQTFPSPRLSHENADAYVTLVGILGIVSLVNCLIGLSRSFVIVLPWPLMHGETSRLHCPLFILTLVVFFFSTASCPALEHGS